MEIDGQVIFLILFVVISGIKWFIEQVKGKNQQPHETSESLEDIYDEFREEIRQRQTRPYNPEPDQPYYEQTTPPPLPTEVEYRQEYIPEPAPPTFEVRKPQLTAQEQAALANLQKRSMSGRKSKRNRSQSSIRDLLASPQSAQQAIILHEILGKPKSLQS